MVTSLIFGFIIAYTLFVILRAHRKHRLYQEMRDREEVHRIDKETAEIAQDIHDEISSGLALITMQLNEIERSGAGSAELVGIRNKLLALGMSLSRVTRQLAAFEIRREGFRQTVSEVIDRYQESRALTIDFTYDLESEPSDEVSLQLYRIILELLQNVIRHAEATHVKLWIRIHEGKLCLFFSDNGKGLGAGKAAGKPGGMGRTNIRKRVNLLRGTVRALSQSGGGTDYLIEIPTRTTYYETYKIDNSG